MNPFRIFIQRHDRKTYLEPGRDGPFHLHLAEHGDSGYFAGVSYMGDESVEVFAGVELPIARTDRSYTLIPAVFYNGNCSEPTKPIPALTAERNFRFEVSANACSNPVALHFDGRDRAYILRGDPFTRAGTSGFVVTPTTLEFVVPAREEKMYGHTSWRDRSRPAARMQKGDIFTFSFHYESVPVNSIIGLFRLLHERYRTVPGYSGVSEGKVPLAQAADLVVDRMVRAHLLRDKQGHCLFTNISEIEGTIIDRSEGTCPSWIQMSGWCGGSMTAYPLLKEGGTVRDLAINNLDFMASTGLAESGLIHGYYGGEVWSSDNSGPGESPNTWKHIRPPADFFHYLLKAVRYEESIGVAHPAWRKAARAGLDAFCGLWDRYGEFGFRIDKTQNPPVMLEGGSCAGAFVLQALAEGMRMFPEMDRYRTVFRAACEYYHRRFVLCGHCTGGPLDIERADDSESAAALTDAFTQGALILNDSKLLSMAEDAAQIFASWVVAYAAPFPPGSTLFGVNPCGGVIANVQNRHIGPGICTNSSRFLYDLAQITDNAFYRRLYEDILHAAVNFVAVRDDEFLGYNRSAGRWFGFKTGVVSEQINLTDALNESGEMWMVACSWPATAILLARAEMENPS